MLMLLFMFVMVVPPITTLRGVEPAAEPARQLDRIRHGPEVHEEEPRLVVQHVVVQGRHLDPVSPERANHRVHLVGGKFITCATPIAGGSTTPSSTIVSSRGTLT